ncbi:hypothetical protein [Morganella morganii]|uniref:hypothetical protein n=1 Tax=Morganella morganii TaxID=582 RepID=UPI00128C957E|nr:hypothetical protein [Morganella morganii]MQC08259.1 hypothetical protein [Morganella morganii]MQC11653.1 hypothetical protein [Morganella morganii]MQC13452.1 hypothetical protein [Morganella morganii]
MTSVIKLEYFVSPLISSEVNLFSYVNDIRMLKNFIENCNLDVKIESALLINMAEEGYYPCDKVFNRIFPAGDECVFSPQDVVRLINGLISTLEEFDSTVSTHEIEWDSFIIYPKINFLSDNRKDRVIEFMKDLVMRKNISGSEHAIFYSKVNDDEIESSFSLTAVVSGIYPELIEEPPFEWNCKVDTYLNTQSYFLSLNAMDLFSNSNSNQMLKCALYCGCVDFLKRNKTNYQVTWDAFRLGPDFYDSLVRNQCGPNQTYSAVVFETLVKVICRMPKNEVLPFRKTATSPEQRVSGDLKAFRTHITESHQALRLMFWVDANRVISLANVGPKFEEEISPHN